MTVTKGSTELNSPFDGLAGFTRGAPVLLLTHDMRDEAGHGRGGHAGAAQRGVVIVGEAGISRIDIRARRPDL